MATTLVRIQLLSKTSTDFVTANPVLLDGEVGVANAGTSIPIMKVGDGVRPWSALPDIVAAGAGADYVAGPVNTLPPGSPATVTIDNSVSPPTISFDIPAGAQGDAGPAGAIGPTGPQGPQGDVGDVGPPNSLEIGTVTTSAPGAPAAATITGTPPDQILNLTLPQGDEGPEGDVGPVGPANELTIGTVTTGAPGSPASATITGTPPAQVLNLTLPQGGQGPEGEPGPGSGVVLATPTGLVGLTAVAGSLTTLPRSDSAPALDQAIEPTWTGDHVHSGGVDLAGELRASGIEGISGQVLSSQGAGLPAIWRTSSGGSIELGWNFSNAVGTANPGSQKMSLNSAVFASVNTAVFNSLAFTNFDANTILSLLRPGNRIYIQQRNDASKAVVYEVTAPGTQFTGYWTIPVAMVNVIGTMFPNNADLNVVFILSTSASASADPTALVGIAAVNGVAATWMRSDAAPALDQAIVPVWSGEHIWITKTQWMGYSAADVATIKASALAMWNASRDSAHFADTIRLANAANESVMSFLRANGTYAAPTTLAAADVIGRLDFYGSAVSGSAKQGVSIRASAMEAWTNTSAAGQLDFFITASASVTPANIVRMQNTNIANLKITFLGYTTAEVDSIRASTFSIITSTAVDFAHVKNALTIDRAEATPLTKFQRIKNSYATPTACTTSDVLGRIEFRGSAVTTMKTSAYVECVPLDTFTDTYAPSRLDWYFWTGTTPVVRIEMSHAYLDVLPQTWIGWTSGNRVAFRANGDINAYGGIGNLHIYSTLGVNRIGGEAEIWLSRTNSNYSAPSAIAVSQVIASYKAYGAITTGYVFAGKMDFVSREAFTATNQQTEWRLYLGVNGGSGAATNQALSVYMFSGSTFISTSMAEFIFGKAITGISFNATSSRAIKRETGRPSRVRDMLARLRPIFYRLLENDSREMLGMIAEEVHEVCPQLSDGKSVAYDRLALLLLAEWQESNGIAGG